MNKYGDGTNSTDDGDGKCTAKFSQLRPHENGMIIKKDVKREEI
jgi:hypothetical protein